MPRLAMRPCAEQGCSSLSDGTRCVEHKHLNDTRVSPRKRGLGAKHQAMSPAILKRDGYVCQLCMKPIDRNAPPRTPMSGSIDHIVPLSKGGTGVASNLRAAHYGCNSARRDDREGSSYRPAVAMPTPPRLDEWAVV